MVKLKDLAYTSLETVTFLDNAGDLVCILDEMQNTTISNTEDKEDITGKGGRKLSSLKRNKAVTVSGASGLVSGGLLSMQTGGEFATRSDAKVLVPEYLIVQSNHAVTAYTASGTAGNEINKVYIPSTGTTLTQGDKATETTFTYDSSTKQLTFSGVADGTEVLVYYFRQLSSAQVLENMSDEFSQKGQAYIDVMAEDMCGKVYRVQFYIPRADFSGNFDLEFSDTQTVHQFEIEALSGSNLCATDDNGNVKKGLLWTYTVFGEDDE